MSGIVTPVSAILVADNLVSNGRGIGKVFGLTDDYLSNTRRWHIENHGLILTRDCRVKQKDEEGFGAKERMLSQNIVEPPYLSKPWHEDQERRGHVNVSRVAADCLQDSDDQVVWNKPLV